MGLSLICVEENGRTTLICAGGLRSICNQPLECHVEMENEEHPAQRTEQEGFACYVIFEEGLVILLSIQL